MNIAGIIKVDTLLDQINEINSYMDVIRDYEHIECKEEVEEEIKRIHQRLAIFLIKCNSELRLILEKSGLNCFID